MAEARYTAEFRKALKKYSAIKANAKKKIEALLENPLGFGERTYDSLKKLEKLGWREDK